MMPTRVVISGSRSWYCWELARRIVKRLQARYGPALIIVEGGAHGVDQAFRVACKELGVTCETFLADWEAHGKRAGPLRNMAMIATSPEFLIACHPDLKSSKGTLDAVRRALDKRIPVYLLDSDDAEPHRVTWEPN